MAQFDVFRNPSRSSRKHYPYLVDVQSPYLDTLATRIVIPLGRASAFKKMAMKGLTPEVRLEDQAFLLLTPQISSIATKHLKDPIGTIAHLRTEILNALDFAVSGI